MFDYPVQRARLTGEPSEHWPRRCQTALNQRLSMRRQIAEGAVIGEGGAPSGTLWRLRVWIDGPDHVHVDLTTADDAAKFEHMDRIGFTGGGYGGPPGTRGKLIKLSSIGRSVGGEQHIIGEVARSVTSVRVGLDNGTEVDAEILRTNIVEDDYFVALPATTAW